MWVLFGLLVCAIIAWGLCHEAYTGVSAENRKLRHKWKGAESACHTMSKHFRDLMTGAPPGVELISRERNRQIVKKGHTKTADLAYTDGELMDAALAYLNAARGMSVKRCKVIYPWNEDDFVHAGKIRSLVKAGALIAAEIDRLRIGEGVEVGGFGRVMKSGEELTVTGRRGSFQRLEDVLDETVGKKTEENYIGGPPIANDPNATLLHPGMSNSFAGVDRSIYGFNAAAKGEGSAAASVADEIDVHRAVHEGMGHAHPVDRLPNDGE